MKLVHQYLPVRTILYQRKDGHSNRCLRCGTKRKTFQHVFKYTCQRSLTTHKQAIMTLQHRLRKTKTHQLIISAVIEILTVNHWSKAPQCPTPMLHNYHHMTILRAVFNQQTHLGPDSLLRGLCVRNWTLLQNQTTGYPPEYDSILWLVAFIRAIWDYSLAVWHGRCKHVNENKSDDPESLTHTQLVSVIRHYLRTPRSNLSTTEKSLHFNISTNLKHAHTKTLTKWIGLLQEERQKTLRQQSTDPTHTKKTHRPITRYFKPTSDKRDLTTTSRREHHQTQRDIYPITSSLIHIHIQ